MWFDRPHKITEGKTTTKKREGEKNLKLCCLGSVSTSPIYCVIWILFFFLPGHGIPRYGNITDTHTYKRATRKTPPTSWQVSINKRGKGQHSLRSHQVRKSLWQQNTYLVGHRTVGEQKALKKYKKEKNSFCYINKKFFFFKDAGSAFVWIFPLTKLEPEKYKKKEGHNFLFRCHLTRKVTSKRHEAFGEHAAQSQNDAEEG